MKKFLLSTAIFYSSVLLSQNCNAYYSFSNGAQYEMKSYNEKDKVTGTTKYTLSNVKMGSNSGSADVQSEIFDANGKLLMTGNFSMKCEEGSLLIDMKSMISPDLRKAFNNMEMKVEGASLDIPSNPQPGQQLKTGTMTMSMASQGGPNMFTMTMTISKRKVEALEKITTPAGTFDCVKISYDIETQMMFNMKTHTVEWYAKGIGMVRSENYNNEGKLQGYQVLTSFKK